MIPKTYFFAGFLFSSCGAYFYLFVLFVFVSATAAFENINVNFSAKERKC